jgi:phosphonate transport system substrate-binding protein
VTVQRAGALAVVFLLVVAAWAVAPLAPAPAQTKLVMAFVPSGEARTILESGNKIAHLLEVATGYKFESFVATSYAGVIEAMGARRADVGWLNTFSYVVAHEKYGVEVRLVTVRFGNPYYKAEIIAQSGSPINSLADLKGKRFAYVDANSTSGYLFPRVGLKKAGYDPDKFFAQTIFAGSHNNVVLAVYQGRVDAGAVFEDARGTVQKTMPDVMQKVKVVWKSDPIPNDTVSFRGDLPADIKDRVTKALLRFSQQPAGLDALKSLYEIEALADYQLLVTKYHVQVPNMDAFFDPVRDAARLGGVTQ